MYTRDCCVATVLLDDPKDPCLGLLKGDLMHACLVDLWDLVHPCLVDIWDLVHPCLVDIWVGTRGWMLSRLGERILWQKRL